MSTEHSAVIPGIPLPPQIIHRALASRDQAVVAIDPHGEVLCWNAEAERLYGYRAEEAIGRPLCDLVVSPAAAAAAAAWRTRLLPGRSCTSDWPVRDKAGRNFVASVMATPVVDDHGETVALIGVSSDVSRRQGDETRALALAAIVEGGHDGIVETDRRGVVAAVGPAGAASYGCAAGEVVGRTAIGREVPAEVGYRAIVEQAQEGIWTGDTAGVTSFANQHLVDMLGVPLTAVYDRPVVDVLDPTGTEGMSRRLRDGGEPGNEPFEIAYAHPDASVRQLRFTLSAAPAVGHPGRLAMVTDVTDLRHAEQELHRRRRHDDLTGLPNRAALEDRLDRAVARRQHRGHGSIAVLSADIDQFKLVNQSHGHAAGDAVLVEVARRFVAALRPEDTVGRFSSDAFAVVCAESSEAEAGEIAVRLQHALEEPFRLDGQAVYLSACVGVALCPPHAAPELLRCAETAMYWAKVVGPGSVRTFERALADEGAARLSLSNDLREALLRDTLTLHYQPIVDLHEGRILGVEALARWHHPTHGPISPGSFVGVAEATGLGPALGRWALNRACRDAERLGAANPTALRVAVNISAAHLADPGLEEAVLTAMRGSRLADGGLVLEITQTSVMGDHTQTRELLQRLRAFGVETAIDDFGTGYSSMAHLSRLPVGTLKIDRSFVRGSTTDPDSLAITESIIRLAHTMRLTVVAQGIETVEQLQLMRRLGCDAGQGFVFSPGLAPDAFAGLVGGLAQARFFDTEHELVPAAVGASKSEPVRRH